MTIADAIAAGLKRVRRNVWLHPRDYVRLGEPSLFFSHLGEVCGIDNPTLVTWATWNDPKPHAPPARVRGDMLMDPWWIWEAYTGEIDPADKGTA